MQTREVVSQFYFPQGKPIDQKKVAEFNEAINKVFGKGPGKASAMIGTKSLGKDGFEIVATDIFKIPKIFGEMIFSRIEEKQGPGGLPKIGNKPKVNK